MLEQDVVAHGVDEGAEAVGLAQFAAAQRHKNARKGFLADVFHGLRGIHARAQFQLDQFAEIGHEMFLRPEVSFAKTLNVGFVKRLELQELAPRFVEVAASLAPQVDVDAGGCQLCNEMPRRGTISAEVDENQPSSSRAFRACFPAG